MADVTKLVPHILKWEGGYVNDPDDLGGATNMGVTFKTYKLYCRRKGYPVPTEERFAKITKEEFTDVLKSMYWDVCKADLIDSQSVANAIVDWAWNSGTGTAIKEVQRIAGIKEDGIVGCITITAINSRSPLPLFGKIKQARLAYIDRICKSRPANLKFYKGWLNRINDIQFEE